LSEKEQQLLQELNVAKVPSSQHLQSLENLVADHPTCPELKNLLIFYYLKKKRLKKAEKLLVTSYKEHPHNIIVRINYADHCLRHGQMQKISTIFSGIYDLSLLYPSQKVFHVSEFRGFMVLMGFYHLSLKDREKAICYHYLAARVDPHHPGVKLLEKKLYTPSPLQNLLLCIKGCFVKIK